MAVPLESFYPFGELNGDSLLGPNDDDYAELSMTQNFTLFGVAYSLIYVSAYCTHISVSYIYTCTKKIHLYIICIINEG